MTCALVIRARIAGAAKVKPAFKPARYSKQPQGFVSAHRRRQGLQTIIQNYLECHSRNQVRMLDHYISLGRMASDRRSPLSTWTTD